MQHVVSTFSGVLPANEKMKWNRPGKVGEQRDWEKWLDGDVGRISALGYGDDTAQITPKEFVERMLDDCSVDIVENLHDCDGLRAFVVGFYENN